jgi:GTP-binding protein HflX
VYPGAGRRLLVSLDDKPDRRSAFRDPSPRDFGLGVVWAYNPAMEQGRRESSVTVARERAILVGCLLPEFSDTGGNPHDPLDELRSLADTAGAVVVDQLLQKKAKPDAGTFIGKGKVEELAELVKRHKAEVVVFENDLSPSQIANVEEEVNCKVIDRSELILDIFAQRARSFEAKLQVELAQLEYTYPRLRAMWSHLERIVGGAPAGIGTRGPGEQQLEIDRRIVQRKKSELRREIAQVQSRKTREVAARNRDFFTVGLVGYTNAGKSTLFNTVTGGGAYADDKLFATLSTRTNKWRLGGGDDVMLSDTVGFVRNLPHHLVASFKATLEEAIHSDLLLVVLDASHPRAHAQLRTVMEVLDDITPDAREAADGREAYEPPRRLLVLNKLDAVDHPADLLVLQKEHPDAVAISAKTGRGLEVLVERVRDTMRGGMRELIVTLATHDGKAINFLENRSAVLDRQYETDGAGNSVVEMTVRIGKRQLDQLRAMGTSARFPDAQGAAGGHRGWGRG